MADEFSIPAFKPTLLSGNLRETLTDEPAVKADQTNKGVIEHVHSIPTTAAGTALTMTNITTAGWTFLKNVDANNFVQVGVQVAGTFYPVHKVLPGKWHWFCLGTNAPYARADGAAVLLHYKICEA